MKNILITIGILIATGLAGYRLFNSGKQEKQPSIVVRRDTVVVRDTIIPPVPAPKIIRVVRHDTVQVGNTDSVPQILPDSTVIIPISTAIYETEDYKAIFEGYKPRLASIELYPKVTTITNTTTVTRSPRWALTGGIGVGYIPGKGIEPYVGVSAGYVFYSK